jgi:urease accessory protein UreE
VLNVLRTLPVAKHACQESALPAPARLYERDTITLGWEERLRARARRVSDGGIEFGIALPKGSVLADGDCLVLDSLKRVIVVVEREEPVLVVEPQNGAEWGLFAYYIGNSHQPVMITDRAIVCPDLPGMEQILGQHRIAFARARRRFTPVGVSIDHRH